MENTNSIDFSINKELADKFSMALKLNNENSKEVITRLMKQYVAETFAKVSKEVVAGPVANHTNVNNEHLHKVENKKANAKITNEMVAIAYKYAKKVYFGEMTRTEGKVNISRSSGMNEGSAQDYITDFLAMMEGNVYHRVMCNYGTAYYLENIRKDFGEEAFKRAISATEKHIMYYNSLGYGQLKQKEKIVNQYKRLLSL